jgi:hypothetical protein
VHGLIFAELKKYVVHRLGGQAWNDLLRAAGMEGALFLPSQVYPDEQLAALVRTASEVTGKGQGDILEDFGGFIAADLLSMYRAQISPTWRTLDIVEHTERLIHTTVRVKIPGAKPPELVATRLSPTSLRLEYRSARKLCPLARGLARGIAEQHKEHLRVSEPSCMLRGDALCDLRLDVAP